MNRTTLWLLVLLLAGCVQPPGSDPTSTPTQSGTPGNISGSFGGRAFDRVLSAWRIGQPDDPQQTLVVYVFDQVVACAELSSPGWDRRVPDASQAVEMKVVGQVPGTYPIGAGQFPGPGEANVNYTLTSTTGAPAETTASAGSVVLDQVSTDSAVGSFSLTFPSGDTLDGTFNAGLCPDGNEP